MELFTLLEVVKSIVINSAQKIFQGLSSEFTKVWV